MADRLVVRARDVPAADTTSSRMRRRYLFSLVFVILVATACNSSSSPHAVSTPTAASAWPMLGHDLSSSFTSADERAISTTSVASLHEIWRATEQGGVHATPAVLGGTVYALGANGVYAFDASSGQLRWKNTTIHGTSSPPVDHDNLFINDGKSVLHALKTGDGTELWHATIDAHPRAAGFSSPVVAGGIVV